MTKLPTITLNYVGALTTSDTVKIQNFSFEWVEQNWRDGPSVTGKRRDTFRGYVPELRLQFESDAQLLSVAESIKSVLDEGGVLQYEDANGDIIPLSPSSMSYADQYTNQIRRRPSELNLEGRSQKVRTLFITGILCGSDTVTCGQENVLCGI